MSSFKQKIKSSLPYLAMMVFVLVLWATLGLAASVALGRPFLGSDHLRGVMARVFLPLMTIFARLFHISKSRVRASFIKVNNEIVAARAGRYDAGQVLVRRPEPVGFAPVVEFEQDGRELDQLRRRAGNEDDGHGDPRDGSAGALVGHRYESNRSTPR